MDPSLKTMAWVGIPAVALLATAWLIIAGEAPELDDSIPGYQPLQLVMLVPLVGLLLLVGGSLLAAALAQSPFGGVVIAVFALAAAVALRLVDGQLLGNVVPVAIGLGAVVWLAQFAYSIARGRVVDAEFSIPSVLLPAALGLGGLLSWILGTYALWGIKDESVRTMFLAMYLLVPLVFASAFGIVRSLSGFPGD